MVIPHPLTDPGPEGMEQREPHRLFIHEASLKEAAASRAAKSAVQVVLVAAMVSSLPTFTNTEGLPISPHPSNQKGCLAALDSRSALMVLVTRNALHLSWTAWGHLPPFDQRVN